MKSRPQAQVSVVQMDCNFRCIISFNMDSTDV